MTVDGTFKLITAILPRGAAHPLQAALKAELDIVTADVHHARGGSGADRGWRRTAGAVEKDVLEVLVAQERAEAVFEFLHDRLRVATTPGSFLYVEGLARAVPMTLPAVPPGA